MSASLSPLSQEPISVPAKAATVGWGCITLFCSIFALIGLGLCISLLVLPLWHISAASSWPSVPCRITSSSIGSHSDSDGTTYSADIAYNYTFGGQNYTSTRYSFANQSSSSYTKAQARVQSLPTGSLAQCFVNPGQPDNAVLNKGFSSDLWIGLFGLPFLAFGVGVPMAMRGQERRKALAFTPDGKSNWKPQLATIQTVTAGGGVQLKPSSASPLARTVALWGFCLFWNAFIGVFAWAMLHNHTPGLRNLMPMVFLMPFALIGVGILGFALYQSGTLLNPRPILDFSHDRLQPGASIDVRWRLDGGWKRPTHVSITLDGIEEVKFTRGTDTLTEKRVFFSEMLYEAPPGAVPTTGSCRLKIPAITMHSFEAPHNSVRWTLTFNAPIALWPAVKAEWMLVVEPYSAGNFQ